MECGFAGNADIYGIGIRIGYYTQAFAVWFATFFHFREAEVLRDVNKLFLFALVVVGLIYVSKARETYAVEPFLLLLIGLDIGLVSIMDSRRYSSRYTRTSAERLISRLLIMGAGLLFNVCFWWHGLDIMLATPCNNSQDTMGKNESATYVWFFAKFSMYGWIRTCGRALSLYEAIFAALTLGYADAVELLQACRMRKTRETFIAAVATYEKSRAGGEGVLDRSMAVSQSSRNPVDPVVERKDATAREERCTKAHSLVRSPQERKSSPDRDQNATETHCDAQPFPALSRRSPDSDQNAAETHSDAQKFPELSRRPPGSDQNSTETHSDAQTFPELSRKSPKILHAVQEAEEFLDSILSIYSERSASLGEKRLIQILGGYVRFRMPQSRYEHNGPKCKLSEGVWAWLMLRWSRNPSISQLWAIELYIYKLGERKFGRLRRYNYRLRQLTKNSDTPDWEMLTVASDIKLFQIPLAKSARSWAGMALHKFFLLVFLIVQVEMTITWNNISGLQRITTLGQIIPFILGVGGLMKVLWGKAWLLWNGVRETHDMDARLPGDYELAMKQYLLWKGTQRDPTAPQSCPDLGREPSESNHQST